MPDRKTREIVLIPLQAVTFAKNHPVHSPPYPAGRQSRTINRVRGKQAFRFNGGGEGYLTDSSTMDMLVFLLAY